MAALNAGSFDKRLGVLTVGKDKSGQDRKINLPPATAAFFAEQVKGQLPAAPLLARADGNGRTLPLTSNAWRKLRRFVLHGEPLCRMCTSRGLSPFISPGVWQSCAGQVLPFGDAPVFAGLDLSARTDLTALVLIGKVAGQWQVVPHFWTPEVGLADRAKRDRAPYDVWHRQGYLHSTPGATIDFEFVATDMAAILNGLNIQVVAFDCWRIDLLKKELDKIGCDVPLIPWGQGFKDMSVALDALEAELLNARVNHGGHPVLQMCAANAIVIKDPAGGRKLDKGRATGRIDGLQAMAQAFGAAAQAIEAEEAYADGQFTFV